MATLRITEAEILDALAVANANDPDEARTVTELMEATGKGRDMIKRALREYAAAGRLVVHRVFRPSLDGRRSRVPAYSIAPAKKPAKRG